MTTSNLEQLAQDAKGGDRDALEMLICRIQAPLFRMAFRMLGFPEDAEDAAQEILIKVITHLAEFRGECSFRSWLYRVACNHLLNTRKRRAEHMNIDFDLWEELIHGDAPASGSDAFPDAEKALLVEEVRIGCTQGMLQCLDRDHRMAVILGEIFEVTGQEGAFILDITPETFRKRLSRGRQRIHAFMKKNCTLVNHNAPCRCRDQVGRDLSTGWIDPNNLHFSKYFSSPEEQARVLQGLDEMEEMARMTHVFRQYPAYQAPDAFPSLVKDLIDAGKFPTLTE